jgi:DNA-binding MarR family transcriptional regulator
LVTKTTDADDGRVRRLAVSAAGTALLEASRARKDAWLTRGLDRLAPGDRRVLAQAAALLERLLEEDA